MSRTRTPFSTTLLCAKNIIHGAMVVPTMATVSERKLTSVLAAGVTVASRVSSQFGCAKTAATM